jgi:hypothetical protein
MPDPAMVSELSSPRSEEHGSSHGSWAAPHHQQQHNNESEEDQAYASWKRQCVRFGRLAGLDVGSHKDMSGLQDDEREWASEHRGHRVRDSHASALRNGVHNPPPRPSVDAGSMARGQAHATRHRTQAEVYLDHDNHTNRHNASPDRPDRMHTQRMYESGQPVAASTGQDLLTTLRHARREVFGDLPPTSFLQSVTELPPPQRTHASGPDGEDYADEAWASLPMSLDGGRTATQPVGGSNVWIGSDSSSCQPDGGQQAQGSQHGRRKDGDMGGHDMASGHSAYLYPTSDAHLGQRDDRDAPSHKVHAPHSQGPAPHTTQGQHAEHGLHNAAVPPRRYDTARADDLDLSPSVNPPSASHTAFVQSTEPAHVYQFYAPPSSVQPSVVEPSKQGVTHNAATVMGAGPSGHPGGTLQGISAGPPTHSSSRLGGTPQSHVPLHDAPSESILHRPPCPDAATAAHAAAPGDSTASHLGRPLQTSEQHVLERLSALGLGPDILRPAHRNEMNAPSSTGTASWARPVSLYAHEEEYPDQPHSALGGFAPRAAPAGGPDGRKPRNEERGSGTSHARHADGDALHAVGQPSRGPERSEEQARPWTELIDPDRRREVRLRTFMCMCLYLCVCVCVCDFLPIVPE